MRVWKTPTQAYTRDCQALHRGESVIIWAVVSGTSAVSIITLKGSITEEKCREVFAFQNHPMMQTLFPVGEGIFQNDNAPIHAVGLVQS
ncbi:DDE_3 domain-containing protein [Trichonephila clavipes]|nr:DDE_3 domain-containing protein [Trichonephila clavipes]